MPENPSGSDPTQTFNLRVERLAKLLMELEEAMPQGRDFLQRWRQTLISLTGLRSSFSLPITCIGPVKSGKSTLINTLAGADLLPTGAGITTSFPTTVRAGQKFSADIELQPEKTINEMFCRAAQLLFSDDLDNRQPSPFNPDDRTRIEGLLDNYQRSSRLTQHGIFNESYRLLRNLIHGAETVAEHYRNEELKFSIDDPEDQEYRIFIRDEHLSPFLLGIEIKAVLKLLPPYLALRDLPGLDTPNPSHQSIIVQQLSESPALIYVISSRIGLRQADYQLLEHLRELGLEERLLFVINLDLDEHHDKKELETIITRSREELSELGFNQSVYAFSSLALFWSQPEIQAQLNKTCRQRFSRWQEEKEKLAYSTLEAENFLQRLQDLGKNRATTALLQHSEKRLQQIIGNSQRLIQNQITVLSGENRAITSDLSLQRNSREKIDAVLRDVERIITGICSDIEKYSFSETAAWLNRRNSKSLHNHLTRLIENYHPPLELLPEKSRNPLTPVRIIGNHFEMTVPGQLRERVVIETLNFLTELHQEINRRLLSGCTPMFIICANFISAAGDAPDESELPLPIKIGGDIPAFPMSSSAEERFAFIGKIQELLSLWSKKILHFKQRRPLGEEYGRQLKKAALKELPRWLGNYAEQLKYALLRVHLNLCHDLISTFFSDRLTSTELALEHSEQLAGDSQLATAEKIKKLKAIEARLELLKNIDEA
ncbi:MAG: dynamin family protein [Deltaproteobacteria bacterium]|nr:dynamin family protein [Deltaproteobacteria bacterium]